VPPPSLFKAVGYDPEPNAGQKQYRRYYPSEMEKTSDENGIPLITTPFLEEPIMIAKKKSKGLFAGLFGGSSSALDFEVKEVGKFKGIVRCYN
jgi:hypothetical protein